MGTDEMPWETESPFTRLLPQFADKPSYFKPDPWHTVNLGTGKSWVASCLVLLLPLFAGNNISVRLEAMSAAYYNFCTTSATRKDSANRLCLSRVPQKVKFITKGITKELLGWMSVQDCPEGHWNKGALTTTLSQFIEHVCSAHGLEASGDEKLRLVASGTRALNSFMRNLYVCPFWLSRDSKNLVVSAGMHHLRACARLALLCYQAGTERFPLTPKHHALWHIIQLLSWQSDMGGGWAMNPVIETCAQDEDMVGRIARVCRYMNDLFWYLVQWLFWYIWYNGDPTARGEAMKPPLEASVSLTLRVVGTFQRPDGSIYGQGARQKSGATTPQAREVDPAALAEEGLRMAEAFRRENVDPFFDWAAHYGEGDLDGFDILSPSYTQPARKVVSAEAAYDRLTWRLEKLLVELRMMSSFSETQMSLADLLAFLWAAGLQLALAICASYFTLSLSVQPYRHRGKGLDMAQEYFGSSPTYENIVFALVFGYGTLGVLVLVMWSFFFAWEKTFQAAASREKPRQASLQGVLKHLDTHRSGDFMCQGGQGDVEKPKVPGKTGWRIPGLDDTRLEHATQLCHVIVDNLNMNSQNGDQSEWRETDNVDKARRTISLFIQAVAITVRDPKLLLRILDAEGSEAWMRMGAYLAQDNKKLDYIMKFTEQYDACRKYHVTDIYGSKKAEYEWGKELGAAQRKEFRALLESMYAEREHEAFLKTMQELAAEAWPRVPFAVAATYAAGSGWELSALAAAHGLPDEGPKDQKTLGKGTIDFATVVVLTKQHSSAARRISTVSSASAGVDVSYEVFAEFGKVAWKNESSYLTQLENLEKTVQALPRPAKIAGRWVPAGAVLDVIRYVPPGASIDEAPLEFAETFLARLSRKRFGKGGVLRDSRGELILEFQRPNDPLDLHTELCELLLSRNEVTEEAFAALDREGRAVP
ncbi:hypothetical protein AK812_SmicGene22740 [Symbiodinium microadriaticum]|uniref:Uncharacterized protein n=1 Tax=Symbiodinium microadriaticum TaxID=2951 RepID=A0A1Q9DJ06_SYMMI|nr:hypothetical protein AK812_SmicGene22740 [Symbiodinium microadriaticum]